jgi:predicted TIM-barrel fold metal-dependent hydrolase
MLQATQLVDAHMHMVGPAAAPDVTAIIAAAGLQQVRLVSIAGTDRNRLAETASGFSENIAVLLAKALNPGRVYAYGGLYYNIPGTENTALDLAAQAQRLIAAGCDGIKMLEGKPSTRKWHGNLQLDAPLYADFFAYLEAEQIPIVLHVNDPEDFWFNTSPGLVAKGWAYDETFPTNEEIYTEVEHVLARHPRLRVTLAHFYFLSANRDRAARFLDRWPSTSFDLTPGFEMYRNFSQDPAGWRAFFTHYADRILLGTDIYAQPVTTDAHTADACALIGEVRTFLETAAPFPAKYGWTNYGLSLDRDALEYIYHRNFHHQAGDMPKPMNLPVTLAECDLAMHYAESAGADAAVLQQIAQAKAQFTALLVDR